MHTHSVLDLSAERLLRWRALTVGLMVVGYSGYYLCRSNLSVALPMIASDLARSGLNPGGSVARVSLAFGWRGAFLILAVVTWCSSAVAVLFLLDQRRVVDNRGG